MLPSQDEHQEAIEVEHAGGGQGGMCSIQRPIRRDDGGILGLYRVNMTSGTHGCMYKKNQPDIF